MMGRPVLNELGIPFRNIKELIKNEVGKCQNLLLNQKFISLLFMD